MATGSNTLPIPQAPLCLVPARGGSKRFPRKNIAPLAGKPLLAWTVEGALTSGVFDAVWVSSEDAETLDTARRWGAQPLLRPLDYAGDQITVAQLCAQVVSHLEEAGRRYDSVYVLLPTSPFRKAETIRQAWQAFQQSGADALMSVIQLESPPQWALTRREGWLRPLLPDSYELPRQRLEPAYRHDGGHAIARLDAFKGNGVFLMERTLAFSVSPQEAVDINEPLDLAWAEFLLRQGMV